MAFFVFGIRRGRQVARINRRAAGRVGNDHAVAEQLSQQLDVRSFAAAGAGARELEQRLNHLGGLRQALGNFGPFYIRQGFKEVPAGNLLFQMVFDMIHVDRFFARIGLVLGRAGGNADAAAGAVFRRHLPDELLAGKFLALIGGRLKAGRRVLQFFFGSDLHADNAVRADERALAALDADGRIPNRNFGRDAAFFILSGTGRPGTVDNFAESGYRQLVAAVGNQFGRQFLDELRSVGRNRRLTMESRGNRRRILYLVQVGKRSVNRGKVLLNDGVALLAVGFLNRVFNLRNRLVFRQNVGNGEETGLHNRIDALSHAGFAGNFNRVDAVEVQFLGNDFFLNFNRQVVPYLFGRIRRVQQKSGARFGNFQNVHLVHERELVAGNEVGLVDQVRGLDRIVRKTQVGSGHRTRFAGVVNEIALTVFAGVFGNDLDRVLVGTDRTVRTQTVEYGTDNVFRFGID